MQPWLQAIQARIESRLPDAALFGICSSAIIARVMPHMSTSPELINWSASCGWLIRPATKTGKPVAFRMAFACGTTYPLEISIGGTT